MNIPASSNVVSAVSGITRSLATFIESAPEAPPAVAGTAAPGRDISPRTGMPRRYRAEWARPTDAVWAAHFSRVMRRIRDGGIIALIGPRGTGKTRLAAEAMRDFAREHGHYTTAMGLFLRIRASYARNNDESEKEIVTHMTKTRLLVLDEVQERGNTVWEDRLLTHILDRRYGAMVPTILIANLTETALVECMGDSIISRLEETGGIIEISGPSHRTQP